MKLSHVGVRSEYVKLTGGLDIETPKIAVYPGALLGSSNYEPGTSGGYRRIDGYERYSGQPSPSDANYTYCEVTLTDTVSVGDTIVGDNSGATGVVIISRDSVLDITKVTGVFEAETFKVGGVPKGSITAFLLNGESTGENDAIATAAAADLYRADIAKPSGSLPVRGVGLLKGVTYCFVDNPGGTAGLIYKATGSGWSAITLYNEISFDTGIAEISDGDSITQLVSGATADVKRVVFESGSWAGGDAAGRLIIDNIVGTFDATNDLQVAAATKATSTSLATAITILPGGKYELREYNFYGSTDTKRMYGCDGKNRGFEFDGDIYVPINTGMATDTPLFVETHKKQLFFSFRASSQNSGVGTPYEWTAVSGATEIAVGDDITGYAQLTGQALGILARNKSDQLLGNNITDFVLDSISEDVGCVPYTVQKIGNTYCLDDRGVIQIRPTQDYGNFSQNTVSKIVQPLINAIRKVAVASTVYRSRDQYRIYGSDGTGVIMTIMDKGIAFASFEYPDNVSCVISGEDTTGKDVVFFGSDDGMVYQADVGSSFDGEEIESFIILPFNNSKSPTVRKTYRSATIQMEAVRYSKLRLSVEFSYANRLIPSHIVNISEVQGGGSWWDIGTWDSFFYDTGFVLNPKIQITGTGTNISISIYGKSSIDLGHKIDGLTMHYTLRRIER